MVITAEMLTKFLRQKQEQFQHIQLCLLTSLLIQLAVTNSNTSLEVTVNSIVFTILECSYKPETCHTSCHTFDAW